MFFKKFLRNKLNKEEQSIWKICLFILSIPRLIKKNKCEFENHKPKYQTILWNKTNFNTFFLDGRNRKKIYEIRKLKI